MRSSPLGCIGAVPVQFSLSLSVELLLLLSVRSTIRQFSRRRFEKRAAPTGEPHRPVPLPPTPIPSLGGSRTMITPKLEMNLLKPKGEALGKDALARRLPFTLGQEVEAKSFSQGYRGAWFICKIVDIDKGGRGQLRYKLQYLNFPEEALHWSQAYQQRHRGQAETTELMLRPLLPPVVNECDLPTAMFDGLVVVPRAWEVGDMINWWCDEVWWEAVVSEILDEGRAKISIFRPPLGEGGSHIVRATDLRPSLVWTVADEWSVPTPKKMSHSPCARLVQLSTIKLQKAHMARLMALERNRRGLFLAGKRSVLVPGAVNGIHDEIYTVKIEEKTPTSPHPQLRVEFHDNSTLESWSSCTNIVPELGALRETVEPMSNIGVDNNNENTPDLGTSEPESEDIYNYQYALWKTSLRRNKKFKRYRKQIKRAVRLARKTTFKHHKHANN